MHLTLHLTDKCNLACRYCYVSKGNRVMSLDTAKAAVDMAVASGNDPTGLVFFGGEPLLCRDLIYDIVEYSKQVSLNTGHQFYYKITTNGLLLDEEFLRFSKQNDMVIGFSHDGLMQDDFRVFADGSPSAQLLEEKIPLLLSYQPYAISLTTVNPENVDKFADSVIWLFNKGFRYLVTTLNYDKSAPWNEKTMKELEKQYKRLAKKYIEWTQAEEKFYFGAFEMKILSHLDGEHYCQDRCQLGKKQISVSPEGKLYPCVQFIDDDDYFMGIVDTGVIPELQQIIERKGAQTPETCKKCSINKRCNYTCGCLNRQATGSINKVSPVQCRHERMLMPIADHIAERLYKKRNAIFLHKQYNNFYPIVSLVEDRVGAHISK